ncbi:hypothetical protein DWB88_13950 (plasmid) [Staphylococcus warneri]|nr:hypothetical protein DWB88_13310 [Staphylococcus warneri]QDW97551.1 hypothetical protein DWB88_13475 [Staphylococcus warneri]QDW97644.1 hypothetical protein DWB88_13950 [Staphylococcus warneri]
MNKYMCVCRMIVITNIITIILLIAMLYVLTAQAINRFMNSRLFLPKELLAYDMKHLMKESIM